MTSLMVGEVRKVAFKGQAGGRGGWRHILPGNRQLPWFGPPDTTEGECVPWGPLGSALIPCSCGHGGQLLCTLRAPASIPMLLSPKLSLEGRGLVQAADRQPSTQVDGGGGNSSPASLPPPGQEAICVFPQRVTMDQAQLPTGSPV